MPLKVLIIRLSAIGDVVHALPLAAAIKRIAPDSEITWIVEPLAASLVQHNPVVDKVLVLPHKAALRSIRSFKFNDRSVGAFQDFWKEFRAGHYDVAIDAQGLFKSAILTYLSGAKIRIGFKGTREFADRFLTSAIDIGDYFGPDRPLVELYLELARNFAKLSQLGVSEDQLKPDFPLPLPPAESKTRVMKWLGDLAGKQLSTPPNLASGGGQKPESTDLVPPPPNSPSTPGTGSLPTTKNDPLEDPNLYIGREKLDAEALGTDSLAPKAQPVAVLIPGTTWSSKIWASEKWVSLATRISRDLKHSLVLMGGPAEAESNAALAEAIKAASGATVLNLTGQATLIDLVALFKKSDLVVGADTGPLHIAAATGAPKVVGIYGPTPTARNGPYGDNSTTVALSLSCQPCFEKICPLGTKACLVDLSPDFAFEKIRSFVNEP